MASSNLFFLIRVKPLLCHVIELFGLISNALEYILKDSSNFPILSNTRALSPYAESNAGFILIALSKIVKAFSKLF